MAEYSIDFSVKLLDAAQFVTEDGLESQDGVRTVLYLSSLASEIALKSLLEQAGKSVKEITKCGHNISGLLNELGKCEIRDEIDKRPYFWVKASRVRAICVDESYSDATIGALLTGEEKGSSKYPNELRYGHSFADYLPNLRLKAAQALVAWAHKHCADIRLLAKSK